MHVYYKCQQNHAYAFIMYDNQNIKPDADCSLNKLAH